MEGAAGYSSCSYGSRKQVDEIRILVVDDDATCLSIVAALLKKLKYEVVAVNHPRDALSTLGFKEFDLVVCDIHMPGMNGFELQKVVAARELNLPLILMSADDKDDIGSKALDSGAASFISKPIRPDDLRDLRRFIAVNKKNEQVAMETESQNRCSKKQSKRRDDISQSGSRKRPKVNWTGELHTRFLKALLRIGLDRCVPKKILEIMNVPGLTRENVASHLQKYRIFLKKASGAADFDGEPSLASLVTSTSVLLNNKSLKQNYENLGNFHGSNSASSWSLTAEPGSGKSRLLSSFLDPDSIGDALLTTNQRSYLSARHAQKIYWSSSQEGQFRGLSATSSGDSILGLTRTNRTIDRGVYLQQDVGSLNSTSSMTFKNFISQAKAASFHLCEFQNAALNSAVFLDQCSAQHLRAYFSCNDDEPCTSAIISTEQPSQQGEDEHDFIESLLALDPFEEGFEALKKSSSAM